jgi:serpin B
VVLLCLTLAGCGEIWSSRGKRPDKQISLARPSFTHLVLRDSPFYTSGPQQSRPPDGTLLAGQLVERAQDAGSYLVVRTEDGTEAHVSAGSLKKLELVTAKDQPDLELYLRLSGRQDGNLFFSPSSISTALAMTYAGARGSTEAEMAQVLHFRLPQERLHRAMAILTAKLADGARHGCELRIANRLWGQQGYGFLPGFLQTTRDYYGAKLAEVDFANNTEGARQQINTWIQKQTEDKIRDLIPGGVLNDLTRLVLANAVYFKAEWDSPFERGDTQDAPFHVTKQQQVNVPTMHQENDFRYAAVEGLKILELPYKEKHFSMVILLPDKLDGLAELEEKLTGDTLRKWLSGLRQQEVHVSLPRFKVTSQFRLGEVLQSMGMTQAFTFPAADFSGMTNQENLFIQAVIHQAWVDVNEEATEAAAATELYAAAGSEAAMSSTFRADHPFVFLIRENQTGSILFLGKMTNPQGG